MTSMLCRTRRVLIAASALAPAVTTALAPAAGAQRAAMVSARDTVSANVSNISYTVTFDERAAPSRTVGVAMSFTTAGSAPTILSLPAWTPGAYELSYFAKFVTNFSASGDGKELDWDKLDFDTWRVRTNGARMVTVRFDYRADSLDNAMAWARNDFLMFNGTNLFLFPEGRGLDFGATVRVQTSDDWLIATGMSPGTAPRTYSASNYHDLVDMPFFVGRFDFDSSRIADTWVRFATYPRGSVTGATRARIWDQFRKMIPPQVAVFGETPFRTYTVLQLADSSYGGASGLEHQNSHVDVITPLAINHPFMPSLYAHEIFHAWNVKRLRPEDLWPYQYANEQPTPWLWVSEGITDYYADLSLVRGGVVDSAAFFETTAGKIGEVRQAPPIALRDASLSTWVHPVDGTSTIYYPKGSLAGLMIDILIRDASDNKRSLDEVMRQLYQDTYKRGRGFTGDQWWRAVSAAAGGKSFDEFNSKYIDGREPYPWEMILPLAGMRIVSRPEPKLGVMTIPEQGAVIVTQVEPGSVSAQAGVRPGDRLVSVGEIPVTDQSFGERFRAAFADKAGAPLEIKVQRAGQAVTLRGVVALAPPVAVRIEADPAASSKATRIRSGILRGVTER